MFRPDDASSTAAAVADPASADGGLAAALLFTLVRERANGSRLAGCFRQLHNAPLVTLGLNLSAHGRACPGSE